MAFPSVTYTFANSTTADATQVNQNFTDLINGLSDGTKAISIEAITAAGKASFGAAFVTSSVSSVVATNGGSSTVANTTAVVILAPAATIATYSLTLPASPSEGQRLCIVSGGNQITALTLAANTGHSLATGAGVTQLIAGSCLELIFRSNVWYRVSRTANVVSEWDTTWTPTGSWNTNVTYTGAYRRVGDVMDGRVRIILSGAPNSANLTVTLPNSELIDGTKLLDTSQTSILGVAAAFDTSASTRHPGLVMYASSQTVAPYYIQGATSSPDFIGIFDQVNPVTWANNDVIVFNFAVPIVGWEA